MESREYDVEIVYRQRAIYRVRAEDREAAQRLAVERWQQGEPGEVPGYGWCELQTVVADEAEPGTEEQDAEVVLRFLQERERLIMRLGGDLASPASNDAISAAQVAEDLGWKRPTPEGTRTSVDVPRATRALERLCAGRRAVCFERPRVRAGERGDIRLYCTPEYLEYLSASLERAEQQVG